MKRSWVEAEVPRFTVPERWSTDDLTPAVMSSAAIGPQPTSRL